MTNTDKTRQSYYSRLQNAGFNLDTISGADYPAVHAKLGWAESTFKTVLNFLGKGKTAKNLASPILDYIPSDNDLNALYSLGSFGRVLAFLGCRFMEMWTIKPLNTHQVIYYPQKKGNPVILDLESMGTREAKYLLDWMLEKNSTTHHMIRNRWRTLQREGKIDRRCKFHSFRHRVISNLAELGYTADQIAMIMGHRSTTTLYRYIHSNPRQVTQARMKAATITRRAKISRWSTGNLRLIQPNKNSSARS